MIYINKFLILDQVLLVKFFSEVNDDEMLKNPFLIMSTGKM